jgi:hypothetical protein
VIIAFTGSRSGCTPVQLASLRSWLHTNLAELRAVHHGACIGADEQFAAMMAWARDADDVPAFVIHAHPCNLAEFVDQPSLDTADVVHDPLPPLTRNQVMVRLAGVLLACPDGPERQRSGTWFTIRFCQKSGKPVVTFWPDGSITEEAP